MTLKIRPAKPNDIDTLLSMITELAEFEKLADEAKADHASLQEALFGERPCAEAIIGTVDNNPAAFAIFFHNFSTFVGRKGLYLEDLYVRETHRGHGYGKAMLQHLAKLAKERRCGRFEWWVLDWNKKAIDFYESVGAKAMDDWTVYRLDESALQRFADS